MRHSNDIDDAMDDAVMVVDHQQKKGMVLYNIRSRYINLELVLGIQAGYHRYIRGAPSLYRLKVDVLEFRIRTLVTPFRVPLTTYMLV